MAETPAPVPSYASTPPAPAKGDRFVKHANLMSVLTILSRVAGLVRDKVCSYFIGVGTVWSAFWIGFQLPNLFRRIFGEGALTAIFVPLYTRTLEKEGKEKADRLASATATALVVFLLGITLVAELVLVPIALSPGVTANNRLAAGMVAVMLPYCVMVCLVALLGAIATVHERFAAQSLSPIILNFAMAAAAAAPVLWFGATYAAAYRVWWVAGAVLVAGGVQVVMMLPTLAGAGVTLRPLFAFRNSGVGEVARAMLPMIIGFSAVQFNTLLGTQIAWWLSPDGHGGRDTFTFLGLTVHTPLGPGAVGALSVAQRIYMLPVGIFGVAMATAIFPLLSRAASNNDVPELKRLLSAGLRKTLFLSIPASAGMIVVARPLITLIYMGGSTTPAQVDQAWWASVWYCIGIWIFETQLVILRVYYAVGDRLTPMRVALWMIVLNFALNLALVWLLREGGIALSTTIAAAVQSAVLLGLLRQRLGHLGLRSLGVSVAKGACATAVMLLACFAVTGVLWRVFDASGWASSERTSQLWLMALVRLPVIVISAGATYAAMAWLLGMPELADVPLLGRLLRRRKGSP